MRVGSRPSPGGGERTAVLAHLLLGERAQHRGKQDALDEHVAVQDQLFAGRRAQALEDRPGIGGPFVPSGDGADQGFHVRDGPDLAGVAAGPVKAQGAAQRVIWPRKIAARTGPVRRSRAPAGRLRLMPLNVSQPGLTGHPARVLRTAEHGGVERFEVAGRIDAHLVKDRGDSDVDVLGDLGMAMPVQPHAPGAAPSRGRR